jgi:hypothetical protein
MPLVLYNIPALKELMGLTYLAILLHVTCVALLRYILIALSHSEELPTNEPSFIDLLERKATTLSNQGRL